VVGDWSATDERPGIAILPEPSAGGEPITARVRAAKQPGDVAIASLHWGANWGYEIPREQIAFAHRLIDEAGIDVIFGHSSHHAKGIEVHAGKPVLYGCGDLLDDYEGIRGYEAFRGDLALLYFLTLDPSRGTLVRFEMAPFRIRRFRLNRAAREDVSWLRDRLDRECAKRGARVEATAEGRLRLAWPR
jgi:poly-gamma-glutamate synthesis protein (capsule biosynthesis protein)